MSGNLPPADLLIVGLLVVAVGTHVVRRSSSQLGIAPYLVSGLLMLAAQAARS